MRVAVVAVHGVADQQPGDTAASIANLLVSCSPAGGSYSSSATTRFSLNVEPLDLGDAAPAQDATPSSLGRPVGKAIAQSLRSDFLRDAASPVRAQSTDLGIANTRFLLAKAVRNGAEPDCYTSSRIEMERKAPGGSTTVHLYEMYWADLSRLAGALPRIVTELFTMVFRLSKLGRETVDNARQYFAQGNPSTFAGVAWRVLAWLQIGLDWAFVNLLAQLFAQLLLVGLLLLVFGAVNQAPITIPIAGAVLLAGGVLWLFYMGVRGGRKLIAALLLVASASGMIWAPSLGPWLFGLVVLAVASAGYNLVLRVADDRFPAVRMVGLAVWLIGLFLVGWRVYFVGLEQAAQPTEQLVQVTLYGVELALIGIKAWWTVFPILFVLWVLATLVAGRGEYARHASVTTGRIGFLASVGVFLVVTMTLWALLSTPLHWAAKGVEYRAVLSTFQTSGESEAVAAAKACFLHKEKEPTPEEAKARLEETSAQVFVRHRYENSTAAFAAVAALILLLVVHVTIAFGPSVLAELKILRPKERAKPHEAYLASRRLGVWLSRGYRLLAWTVLAVALLGALAAIVVALYFAYPQSAFATGLAGLPNTACLPWASTELLKPLVFSAAGLAAAITAFGNLLSRYLPGVRAPLDILLDVDNYFREFPRRNIPRARIFSRYHALLRHVAAQNYDRIVIVAHSQGTVISADLLRLLSDPSVASGRNAERTQNIATDWCADVRLLTFGSPLRQLYAARFPCQYAWMLENGATIGPSAAALGVRQWGNAFTSGDYVGRWFWSAASRKIDPFADHSNPKVPGGGDPYQPVTAQQLADPALAGKAEFEMCIGLGAHTHYFEPDQKAVACLVDRLIAAPKLAQAAGS